MKTLISYPFSAIVGHELMKLALLLTAIDPRIGGILIQGPRGMAKSTSARALADLVLEGRFITLPLGATEERLLGSLNLEKVLNDAKVEFAPGLLQAAHQGVLYVDEVNLLPDHLVDLLLDVSVSGINLVERDGISHQHPARFVLIGTMNPDEGELRPQLLDRFGFAVFLSNDFQPEQRVEIVKRRLAFDSDPEAFCQMYRQQQQALLKRSRQARECLAYIPLTEKVHRLVAELCHAANVEGVRADLVMLRAARAHAAWQQRESILEDDVYAVAELALHHRRKTTPPPSPQASPSPPAGRHSVPQDAAGDWGELPPRSVPIGQRREIGGLLKKKR
jgi:magnesium chelatase subunit I